jgi:hypothetical protein
MRTLLLTASAVTLALFSTVQFATAAATIPDYELHVNTRSAHAGEPGNIENIARAWRGAVGPAAMAAEPTEPEWLEIPARR